MEHLKKKDVYIKKQKTKTHFHQADYFQFAQKHSINSTSIHCLFWSLFDYSLSLGYFQFLRSCFKAKD